MNASVNKVVLRHLPTGLIVTAHDDRSVERNKTIAYERLKYKVRSSDFRLQREFPRAVG